MEANGLSLEMFRARIPEEEDGWTSYAATGPEEAAETHARKHWQKGEGYDLPEGRTQSVEVWGDEDKPRTYSVHTVITISYRARED